MFHLAGAPRRAPFSDWLAQVERIAERNGVTSIDRKVVLMLRSYYDCGVSPRDAITDLLED